MGMKVYGYARVSTSEQASSGDSLDTQRKQIEAWATLKGWAVETIFIDGGVSGSVPMAERPEGERLLRALRKGDAVITARLDRMFRSASDALGTLEELKADNVALHMIDLGGDVCGNGISKLVFTILSAVSENERDRIRERIRDVKKHLREEGRYAGGSRPFGWDIVDGTLVPNFKEGVALDGMKKARARGDSYAKIGAAFNKPPMTIKRILDRIGV